MNEIIENNILEDYQKGFTCRQIAKKYNLVHSTVSLALKRNGKNVRLFNRPILENKKLISAIDLYINQKKDMYEIANILDISYGGVRNAFIRNSIKIRTKSESQRRFKVDEKFFEDINNEKKAYILGLIFADGYNNNYGFNITLVKTDYLLLEKIREIIKSKKLVFYPKKRNVAILRVNSKKISEDLTKLGCIRNKSLVLKFPSYEQVPECLFRHFLRGYFDGDGCLAIDKRKQFNISVVSSPNFIDSLYIYFQNKFQSGGSVRKKGNVKELIYGGNKQALKIGKFLYENSTIYLERKYQKYLLAKENYIKKNNL